MLIEIGGSTTQVVPSTPPPTPPFSPSSETPLQNSWIIHAAFANASASINDSIIESNRSIIDTSPPSMLSILTALFNFFLICLSDHWFLFFVFFLLVKGRLQGDPAKDPDRISQVGLAQSSTDRLYRLLPIENRKKKINESWPWRMRDPINQRSRFPGSAGIFATDGRWDNFKVVRCYIVSLETTRWRQKKFLMAS